MREYRSAIFIDESNEKLRRLEKYVKGREACAKSGWAKEEVSAGYVRLRLREYREKLERDSTEHFSW